MLDRRTGSPLPLFCDLAAPAPPQVNLLWEGAAASFKTSLEAALEAVPSATIMVLLKVGRGEGEGCFLYAIVGGWQAAADAG